MGQITDLIVARIKSKFSFKVKLCIVLFFVALAFSPGVLLTLPPNSLIDESNKKSLMNGVFVSSETNIIASIVHAFVITFVIFIILSIDKIQNILVR